ncbi:MAG: hypothetical protein ACM3RP_02190 [Chitinophagales bacterium]
MLKLRKIGSIDFAKEFVSRMEAKYGIPSCDFAELVAKGQCPDIRGVDVVRWLRSIELLQQKSVAIGKLPPETDADALGAELKKNGREPSVSTYDLEFEWLALETVLGQFETVRGQETAPNLFA